MKKVSPGQLIVHSFQKVKREAKIIIPDAIQVKDDMGALWQGVVKQAGKDCECEVGETIMYRGHYNVEIDGEGLHLVNETMEQVLFRKNTTADA